MFCERRESERGKPFSPREPKPGEEVTEMKLVIEIVEDSRVLVHHPGT